MKTVIAVILLAASFSQAQNSRTQAGQQYFKTQACGVYAQNKSDFGPKSLQVSTYVRQSDGSYKEEIKTVPNQALFNGMSELEQVCLGRVPMKMSSTIEALNKIGTNITDGDLQLKLLSVVNEGMELWKAEIQTGLLPR